jgi:N-methylhydantoinase B
MWNPSASRGSAASMNGGEDGAPNRIEIRQGGVVFIPEHLSKDQDIALAPGDHVTVHTPGGGGFGDPAQRESGLVETDLRRGYYKAADVARRFRR